MNFFIERNVKKVNNSKLFFITVDTEEDNQWSKSEKCTTNNTKYLPRFQELAEKYGFKPTWLTTYKMVNDNDFVKYFKEKQNKDLCEIGMHLHAWNTPPEYKLNRINNEKSYLIEYPPKIMEEKIKNLDEALANRFGTKPISHRAGRWTMNEEYFELLKKHGYKIDCSVTPHINWEKLKGSSGVPGSDYSKKKEIIDNYNGIIEIPVTIKKIHYFDCKKNKNIKHLIKEFKRFICGRIQWIRLIELGDIDGIMKAIDKCNKNNEYIMFMIHSSELMPGGSPYFKTKEDIEKLYRDIEYIFKYSKKIGYKGITMREYYLKNGDKNELQTNQ